MPILKPKGTTPMRLKNAKQFIKQLSINGHLWHFDDCPLDSLNGVASNLTARRYGEKIAAIYAAGLDWGAYGCPIGYAIAIDNKLS